MSDDLYRQAGDAIEATWRERANGIRPFSPMGTEGPPLSTVSRAWGIKESDPRPPAGREPWRAAPPDLELQAQLAIDEYLASQRRREKILGWLAAIVFVVVMGAIAWAIGR